MSAAPSLLLVTGMAGAGRQTCLKALEDAGFEAVDNLPLDLLARLLAASDHVIEDMLTGLGAELARVNEPFHPVRAAYHAHGHGHEHGHSHD